MRMLATDGSEAPHLIAVGAAVPKTSGPGQGDPLQLHVARRVLVVQDESPMRQMLAELLKSAGYGVLQAGDGFQALQIVREDRPDLIVLDLMLPRMNGWQFLERSRQLYVHQR